MMYLHEFFASLKKGVGSGVGSGSISQRYVSGDPDPHQNVTGPQHCFFQFLLVIFALLDPDPKDWYGAMRYPYRTAQNNF